MKTALLIGTILALAAGTAAYGQDRMAPTDRGGKDAPPTTADEAGEDASATVAALQPGMVVKDVKGETVGTIQRVTQSADGRAAVILDVDGQPVNLAPTELLPASDGAGATSAMTKAQIKAAAAPR